MSLVYRAAQRFELSPCLNSLFCAGKSPKIESIWAGEWGLLEMGALPNPPALRWITILHIHIFPQEGDVATWVHCHSSFSLCFSHMELLQQTRSCTNRRKKQIFLLLIFSVLSLRIVSCQEKLCIDPCSSKSRAVLIKVSSKNKGK